MRVVVIDCNLGRHEIHENVLKKLELNNFKVQESIDVDLISEINADILVVHKNNIEFSKIESLDDDGKIRIFFSDGYHTEYVKDDFNYYVPFNNIEETLKNIIHKLAQQRK